MICLYFDRKCALLIANINGVNAFNLYFTINFFIPPQKKKICDWEILIDFIQRVEIV